MRIQPMAAVLFLLLAANADGAETSLQSGTTFQDCTDCPVMVVIPPGSFMMGETVDEETTWHEEAGERGTASPPRKITIRKSFALGKFEITRAEFAAFVKETNYRQHGDICLRLVANTNVDVPRGGHFQPDASSIQMTGLGWRNPGFTQTDRDPVICADWADAKNYASWLSKKTGHRYFLPSEAQWEYAARAGTTTPFWWGENGDEACKYENVADESFSKEFHIKMTPYMFHCDDGFAYTAPVGSYKPNAFGLYDVAGNAWEWTEDCQHDNYDGAPTDGSAWVTDGDCARHWIRNPAWEHDQRGGRMAVHFGEPVDSYANAGGFRIARELP